jgi:hypothetical protein
VKAGVGKAGVVKTGVCRCKLEEERRQTVNQTLTFLSLTNSTLQFSNSNICLSVCLSVYLQLEGEMKR